MSWLEDLLGYKDIRNALGALVPRRTQLRFLDGGVTDNPTLGTTDITFGATSLHSAQTMADGLHGAVRWSFSSAALRRAFVAVASDIGGFAFQTDTSPLTLWYIDSVSGGVATWRQVSTAADSSFDGDYAALAATFSLTTLGFWRGDLGVSGTSGTGKALWTNQSGSISNITPHAGATNGIGAIGTGLGGKASIITDGSTQKGQLTAPTLAAPATTNHHKYWIGRQLSGGSGSPRGLLGDPATAAIFLATGTTLRQVVAAGGIDQTVSNDVWQRGRSSFTGSSADEIKLGSQTAVTGTGSNTAPPTVRIFGDLLTKWEWLLCLELQGTKANFLSFAASADTKSQLFWTSAIEI